jgi:hypothetical protein
MPIVSILDSLMVIKTVTKKVEGIQNRNLQLIQKIHGKRKSQVPAPLDVQTSVSVLGERETKSNDQNTPLQQNEV